MTRYNYSSPHPRAVPEVKLGRYELFTFYLQGLLLQAAGGISQIFSSDGGYNHHKSSYQRVPGTTI